MSKYSAQQYRYQKQLSLAARDIYSQARIYKLTHNTILELRDRKLFNTAAWKHANGYVKAHVNGVLDTLFSAHYQVLSWGFVVDGHILTVPEMRARWPKDWYTRCIQSTDADPGNGTHFYDDPDPSKRKPF